MVSRPSLYIYDDFLNERRHEREVASLEARLATLDLQGRVARISPLRSPKEMVFSMLREEASTVVVVGNDRTLEKVMWFLPDANLPVGYLPLGAPSVLAELLRIPVGLGACDVLAARHIETFDLGKIDDRYFLGEVRLPKTSAAVSVPDGYSLSPIGGGEITFRNLGFSDLKKKDACDAQDGLLELSIVPAPEAKSGWFSKTSEPLPTRLLVSEAEVVSPGQVDVLADHQPFRGARFRVSVQPGRLRIIAGRTRHVARERRGPPASEK